MPTITTTDGAEIFFKDWGPRNGQPIVFHHGWPLNADDWDTQMLFFAQHGYRVIAHDRRGHGRSSQTADGHDMDTYAADVAAFVEALDLRVIHVAHSTGGGEAVRYVARHGAERADRLVLIGAVPPILIKSPSNPDGIATEVFDGLRASLAASRSACYWDFIVPFYSYNRPGAAVNEQVRLNWWRQAMMGAANAQYLCIKAFSETDFTEDLRAVDVPILFMHGEDDQIVPVAISAMRGIKLAKRGTLKLYPGLPHGMATTHAERINADLLAFIRAQQDVAAADGPMKIVVIGGSGLIGSKLVKLLRAKGHEVLAASPDTGVNTLTGQGLDDALAGAQVVVDVANSPSFEDKAVMDFFRTTSTNLLAAEARAGVKHHVALSIVGTQRVVDSGYLRAKAAQEDLIRASPTPYTILQSTQFFEFIERIAKEALVDGAYRLSPALMQPIVSDETVATLADIVLAPPKNATVEVGGPEAVPLSELAREVLSAKGDGHLIIADPHARYFGAELNDSSLVPGPAARLGSLKFGDWLRRSISPD